MINALSISQTNSSLFFVPLWIGNKRGDNVRQIPQNSVIEYVFQKSGSAKMIGTSPVGGLHRTSQLNRSAHFKLFISKLNEIGTEG